MTVYTAKLSVQDAAFPLLSRNSGRSAIIPNVDSNTTNEPTPSGLASNVSSVFNAVAKPHIVYAENVIPRSGGFSSVGYLRIMADGVTDYPSNCYTLQVRNMGTSAQLQEGCIVIFYEADTTMAYKTAALIGTVTVPSNTVAYVTQANVGGIQFCFDSALFELRINTANTNLEAVQIYAPSIGPAQMVPGISNADFAEIEFCCAAGNYLIFAKTDGTIYWSNPTMGQYLNITLPLANAFTVGNTITGGTSGATASFVTNAAGSHGLYIGSSANGTFVAGEAITAEPSVQVNVASITGFTIGDTLTGQTSGATGSYWTASGSTGLQLAGTVTGTFTAGEQIKDSNGHSATVVTVGTWTPTATLVSGFAPYPVIDAPDFIPSLITGAGFEIPSSMSGRVIGLQSWGDGFLIHTNTRSIIAKYSNNAQAPWVFLNIWNSVPIGNSLVNGMPTCSDNPAQQIQVAWTDSGIMELSTMPISNPWFPEVSDFLGGQLIEVLSSSGIAGTPQTVSSTPANAGNIDLWITRIANRYLCFSYGLINANTTPIFTQCLIYDTALKRWGKLVVDHVAVVFVPDTFSGVSDLHDIGIITPMGGILCCTEQVYSDVSGTPQNIAHHGVLIMGGINFVRGNVSSTIGASINYGNISQLPDVNAESLSVGVSTSTDGVTVPAFTNVPAIQIGVGSAAFLFKQTAPYHFVKMQGYFHISEFEVKLFKTGVR